MNKLIPLALAALGLATPASAQITAFQHIILVIQENRTPDNLFYGLCTTTQQTPCSTNPGPRPAVQHPDDGMARRRRHNQSSCRSARPWL